MKDRGHLVPRAWNAGIFAGLSLGLGLLAASGGAQEVAVRDPAAVYGEALHGVRDPAKYPAVVAACRQVVDSPKAPARLKQRAYDTLIEVHTRKGARQEAIEAAEALRKAYGSNVEIDRRAVFTQADLYWGWKENTNPAPAVAVLKAFTERRPREREAGAQAHLRIAQFQLRAAQYEPAGQSARNAMATDPANASLSVEALWLIQDAAARARKPEDRLKALLQSLEPAYRDALSEGDLTTRRDLVVATLRELKRYEELRRLLGTLEADDTSAARRQQWAFTLAETWADEGRSAEALAAYERVFTGHPTVNVKWGEAQARIVDLLAKLGRTDDALRAAHVWYDSVGAGSHERVNQRITELLRAGDAKSPRAESFMAMHRYGPAGKDGKAGTADDPAAVLPAIGYPDATARRAAFEAAVPALGDGVDASLQRGWCCIYAGDPRRALAHFADAFRRCPAMRAGEVGRIVMLGGFRAIQGHGAGLEEVGQFLAWGPAGPDGQAGTDDDVTDPFSAAGLAGASKQAGGLVPLAADEAAQLQRLAPELRELITRSETSARQVAAVNAYQRVCEALVTLDRAETLGWIRGALRRETDEKVQGALVRLGLTVAKADQLHMAGARQFWADVAADYASAQKPLPGEVASSLRQFEGVLRLLEKKVVLRR